MKSSLSMLFGAALALGGSWLLSAHSPAPAAQPLQQSIKVGDSLFGFNVLKGTGSAFANVSDKTPVSVRQMKGNWALVDYPSQGTGAVWVNMNSLISYRMDR